MISKTSLILKISLSLSLSLGSDRQTNTVAVTTKTPSHTIVTAEFTPIPAIMTYILRRKALLAADQTQIKKNRKLPIKLMCALHFCSLKPGKSITETNQKHKKASLESKYTLIKKQ